MPFGVGERLVQQVFLPHREDELVASSETDKETFDRAKHALAQEVLEPLDVRAVALEPELDGEGSLPKVDPRDLEVPSRFL